MSHEVVFLEKKEPLALQVAARILQGQNKLPIDLADTQIWVPTAGAGRRIREALAVLAAERQTGVLSPAFLQPMQALLPDSENIATRSEREAAWVAVLRDADEEKWEQLLPDPAVLSTAAGALGVAGMFCDLCDLLVEGGLNPTNPVLEKICSEDAGRWQQLRALHTTYLDTLAAENLSDPNELRLHVSPPPDICRIIVACIPDLAEIATKHLETLSKNGLTITILVWKPADLPGGWDAWGRPLPEEWATCPIPIVSTQIHVARQAEEEASQVLDFLANAAPPGDYALALADETLGASLAGEITRRHRIAFLPEGRTLATEEPAKIALEWENWQTSGDLRTLRNLLQSPHFNQWLANKVQLSSSELLTACDELITTPLVETLSQARDFIGKTRVSRVVSGVPPETPPHPGAAALITTLDALQNTPFQKILETHPSEAAQRVLELWNEISHSAFYIHWTEGRLPALSRALRSETIFTSAAPESSIELSGWLETPWIEANRLAICGCIEGKLPTSIGEHPFLPDSKRAALGLQDNARRLARDAYLLTCLLARHGANNLQLSFSRFDSEGSPALPSRLLLRTTEANLAERVQLVFTNTSTSNKKTQRTNHWLWSLPTHLRLTSKPKISPTQCKDYLACPTRFYWKNILHLETYDPDPREMDARSFGTIIHKVVEMFGRRAPDESKENLIAKLVLEELQWEAEKTFGPSPTAAIRVQLESAAVRLRAFARVQAAEYAAGWRILEVEKRIAPDAESPIKIGPLNLSAQVDRIEKHPEHGLRILDYKTFSAAKTPEKTHFGKANPDHFLPQSQVTYNDKEKSWTDLQLPLYRHIASQLYDDTNIQTAYFLLTADPSETQIATFDIDAITAQSALDCATEIAHRIASGIYWPPQAPSGNWEDAYSPLFLNGANEKCFDCDTINFLKGQP